eukprot:scaffold108112_cov23-Tisochrysis_lutea.AAC.1
MHIARTTAWHSRQPPINCPAAPPERAVKLKLGQTTRMWGVCSVHCTQCISWYMRASLPACLPAYDT